MAWSLWAKPWAPSLICSKENAISMQKIITQSGDTLIKARQNLRRPIPRHKSQPPRQTFRCIISRLGENRRVFLALAKSLGEKAEGLKLAASSGDQQKVKNGIRAKRPRFVPPVMRGFASRRSDGAILEYPLFKVAYCRPKSHCCTYKSTQWEWGDKGSNGMVVLTVASSVNLKATDRILRKAGAKCVGGGYVV